MNYGVIYIYTLIIYSFIFLFQSQIIILNLKWLYILEVIMID